MARGFFVTLEGIEGIGKTTQLQRVEARLRAAGLDLEVTREPGGTRIGEAIRGLLLDPGNAEMAQDCELLLMFAARSQHLAQRIRPALAGGTWVLSDRFTDSSFAYQGGGRGLDWQRIRALEDWVQGGLQPDLTLLLDADVDTAIARVTARGGKDRFEREALEFFHRVREAFLRRAHSDPERFAVIDASGDIETVGRRVDLALTAFLAAHDLPLPDPSDGIPEPSGGPDR